MTELNKKSPFKNYFTSFFLLSILLSSVTFGFASFFHGLHSLL